MAKQDQQHSDDEHSIDIDASVLEAFLRSISTGVDPSGESRSREAVLEWSGHELRTLAIDPADVVMTESSLHSDVCESFSSGEDATVGLNLDRALEALSLLSSAATVRMSFDIERRTLSLSTPDGEFDLSTIDPDAVRAVGDVPDLEFSVDVAVPAVWLRRAREACDMTTGDHLAIEPGESGISILGEGDTDEARFGLDADDLDDPELTECRSVYSTAMLEGILEGLTDDVRVRIAGDELPMRIDSDESFGAVAYTIAPRLEVG